MQRICNFSVETVSCENGPLFANCRMKHTPQQMCIDQASTKEAAGVDAMAKNAGPARTERSSEPRAEPLLEKLHLEPWNGEWTLRCTLTTRAKRYSANLRIAFEYKCHNHYAQFDQECLFVQKDIHER